LPRRFLAGLEPQREIACLDAAGEMPGNFHRPQESVPRQQFVGVRPQRNRAGVVGEHVVQELGYSRHLHAMVVKEPEGHQRVAGLLHPADPAHLQPRDIPDCRAVLCHPNLRGSPLVDEPR